MVSGGFYLHSQFDICMIYSVIKGVCEVNTNFHF